MKSIYTRVSIRKYQDRPVEKEKTEAILRAAMQAPSAGNQQPWEFYVVTNKPVAGDGCAGAGRSLARNRSAGRAYAGSRKDSFYSG